MEMNQIRYFLAVARERSFTRAAETCNVTQPSLTRGIKRLELELGGLLFHRGGAETHLSELGRIVLPHLLQLAAEAETALRLAQDASSLRRTQLRLGLMCTIAPGLLLELVRGMRIGYPGVELMIVDSDAAAIRQSLEKGELDVAVCCEPESEAFDRLHKILLFRERFVIALSADHLLAALERITPRDLDGQHYLERISCEYGGVASRLFEARGVADTTVYRSDRDDWIVAMAASGIGYAFMPEHCARHADLVLKPLVDPEIWREVYIVTVRGRPHSPAVGAFVKEAIRLRQQGLFEPVTGRANARRKGAT